MGDEQRRRDVRVVIAREVDVRIVDRASGLASGDSFAAEVRNISVGGALLVMPEPLWRGPTLEIRIGWADPRLVASLRASVVRNSAVDDEQIISASPDMRSGCA